MISIQSTSEQFFLQTRIVLINTTDPGNIGASARAMKTMGFKDLYLVAPKVFPHKAASKRASHAIDILASATVVSHLKEALQDCHLVIGTSTRMRDFNWVTLTARTVSEKIAKAPIQTVAFLFGCEQYGLSNEEMQHCHYHVIIPTASVYRSLNLAAAVQIICYELRIALLGKKESVFARTPMAPVQQQEYFYQHLLRVLVQIEFLKPTRRHPIMRKLRRLFSRAELDITEINILRGILTAIEKNRSLSHNSSFYEKEDF